jgi:hypothetical protein
LSLELQIEQKSPCFVSCYDAVQKRPILVSTIDQITASAAVFVASSPTIWEQLTCTYVATSWTLSSFDSSWLTGILIIFQTVSALYKTFVLLKHSTTAQVFLAICLLII